MPRRKITPHKGGRTARITVRLTPEHRAALDAMARLDGVTTADVIERLIARELRRRRDVRETLAADEGTE